MLVLSRKRAEAIRIDGEITIKVLEVRGGKVRLGIEAPDSVRIRRSEVHDTESLAAPGHAVTIPIPKSTPKPRPLQSAIR